MKTLPRNVTRFSRTRTLLDTLEPRQLLSTVTWQTAFSGIVTKLHVTPAPAVVSQPPTHTTASTTTVTKSSGTILSVPSIVANIYSNLHLAVPAMWGSSATTIIVGQLNTNPTIVAGNTNVGIIAPSASTLTLNGTGIIVSPADTLSGLTLNNNLTISPLNPITLTAG